MTTAVQRQKRARPRTVSAKAGKRKPSRIRAELLPASVIYLTIDGTDYVAVPLPAFAAWYEAIEDRAVADYTSDPEDSDKPHRLIGARKKVLPATSKKLSIEKTRFHAVPVADFAEWYEDIWDGAICQYVHENPELSLPFAEVLANLAKPERRG